MKKLFTFVLAVFGMAITAHAQDFAYQYHGNTLDDGSTVTIEAEPDFFGEPECNTNPSDDNKRLTFKKLGSSFVSKGSATITIEQNTLGSDNKQWCMGGDCRSFTSTTYTKDFDFSSAMVMDNNIMIQYDIAPKQYGEMLTKLVSTIGGKDYTVYIKFTYTDPASVQNVENNNAFATARYNVVGQRVAPGQHGIAITRLSNGKVVKTVNK